jgi:hypothetical protein
MGERDKKEASWLALHRSTAKMAMLALLRKNVGRNGTSSQEVQRFSGVLT